MSAGPSRSRVTRIELTADQLLGADLIPARPHKPSKNVPKVITVEQLLGSSLTIARGGSGSSSAASPSSSRSASRTSARPPPNSVRSAPPNSVRSAPPRSPSPRRVPVVPHRERVTADEVLRTGLPLRALQAAKQRARSAQALVLTADQLLGSSSGSGSSRSNALSPSRVVAESSRRPNTAGDRTGRHGRLTRPSTAGATTTSGDGTLSVSRGRENLPRQARRSSSLGSTHTLPIYTKEPGESEVVIDRGTEELEDEIPITVMTPVEEDGPSLANGVPNSIPSPPVSPDITQQLSPAASPTDSSFALSPARSFVINPNPISATLPISIPGGGRTRLPPGARSTPFPDEIPSYEAVMSMSTPNLHGFPANIPLPSSPTLSALGSPRTLSPSTGPPSTPVSPDSHPGSPSPPPPDGAESPRRRFGFMSLFYAHPPSLSPDYGPRSRGRSVSGLPSQIPEGVASDGLPSGSFPPVECPRPRLRSSRSVLDLLSRSWSDNPMARSRSDRGPSGA